MAKTEAADAPQKHFLTICDENGNYREAKLTDLNRDAQGHLAGRKKREASILKSLAQSVAQHLKKL